jgi:hypothetical protein
MTLETLSLTVRPHRLESRMREIRQSGSEGEATLIRCPYPYPILWASAPPAHSRTAGLFSHSLE